MSYIIFLLYQALERLIYLLPLPAAYHLGRLLGHVAYYLVPTYRALALRNLQIAFAGEKSAAELRALTREHFATLGANLFSSIKVSGMPPEQINACVDLEELKGLFTLAAEGRGIILVISHMGNWELLSQFAAFAPPGLRIGTIYQPLGNQYLDEHVKKMRNRFGVIPFDRRRGFVAPIQLLREGGMVGVLVDQHAGDGGVWAPLFGRLASTSPLAATLASRTGAHLVPVAVYSDGPAHWKFSVRPPLPAAGATADELTAAINAALEAQVCASPRDWFWVHNRWKTPRPEFLLSRYKRGVALPRDWTPARLKPFPILIRSTNWLGDAVISAPAVRAIHAGRPDVRLTVLTPAKLADFWKTMPEVSDIIPIAPGENIFAVARKIGRHFEAAFIFPNSIRAALEVFLAGVPRRVGFRRPWRGKMINQVVPESTKPAPPRHQVHRYLAMVRHAGADIDAPLPAPDSPPPGGAFLGLCPGAEYGPAKRWPAERFAEAARRVHEQTGLPWLLFGVEKDRPFAEAIAAQLDPAACRNLAGQTTLAELIAHLRQCLLLLTNDTGTMHLAAHLGVPLVAIFGSTEPALTGPLGSRSRVLRHRVPCSPCFLRECPLDLRCMHAVTPQEAAAAVLQELRRAGT